MPPFFASPPFPLHSRAICLMTQGLPPPPPPLLAPGHPSHPGLPCEERKGIGRVLEGMANASRQLGWPMDWMNGTEQNGTGGGLTDTEIIALDFLSLWFHISYGSRLPLPVHGYACTEPCCLVSELLGRRRRLRPHHHRLRRLHLPPRPQRQPLAHPPRPRPPRHPPPHLHRRHPLPPCSCPLFTHPAPFQSGIVIQRYLVSGADLGSILCKLTHFVTYFAASFTNWSHPGPPCPSPSPWL